MIPMPAPLHRHLPHSLPPTVPTSLPPRLASIAVPPLLTPPYLLPFTPAAITLSHSLPPCHLPPHPTFIVSSLQVMPKGGRPTASSKASTPNCRQGGGGGDWGH